jgi:glycine cleavage system H protein
MEGFTYTDIFETKGIEYIIIIAFLILLIPFWIIVNKKVNVAQKLQHAIGVLKASILSIPQGIFYSKNHVWAFLEKSGNAKIGLDDFLLKIIGDVRIVCLKQPGEKVNQGDVVAEVFQNGKQLRIISPISGEIINSNPDLLETPTMVQEDPYGNGYIYEIKPSNWKGDIQNFHLADEASQWMGDEMLRFKDFMAESVNQNSSDPVMVVYQDGGELRQQILSELDAHVWDDFQKTFLSKIK